MKIKGAFGFFFTGLTISKDIGRPLTKTEFPIENDGTTDPELKYNNYRVCCQDTKEFVMYALIQPISGRGVLVRISPTIVAKSFFYWEIIVFLEKLILIVLATKFDQNEYKDVQLVFALLILALFLIVQVYN